MLLGGCWNDITWIKNPPEFSYAPVNNNSSSLSSKSATCKILALILVVVKRVLLNQPTTDTPTIRPPPLTHRTTDQPTTDPSTNRQDSISKTWSMENIHYTERKHSWEDVKLYFGLLSIKFLFIFIKSLSLVFFERKLLFYRRHTEDLIMFIFYILNLTAVLLPRYSQFISTYGNFNRTRCFSTQSTFT